MTGRQPTTDARLCPACRRENPDERMTCWRCGGWMDSLPADLDDEDELADWSSGYGATRRSDEPRSSTN